jgi:hypothetical protein
MKKNPTKKIAGLAFLITIGVFSFYFYHNYNILKQLQDGSIDLFYFELLNYQVIHHYPPENMDQFIHFFKNDNEILYNIIEELHHKVNMKIEDDTIFIYWFGTDGTDGHLKHREYTNYKSILKMMFSNYDLILSGCKVYHLCDFSNYGIRFYSNGKWIVNNKLSNIIGGKILPILQSQSYLNKDTTYAKNHIEFYLEWRTSDLLSELTDYPKREIPVLLLPNGIPEQKKLCIFNLKQREDKSYNVWIQQCDMLDNPESLSRLYFMIDTCLQNIKIDTISQIYIPIYLAESLYVKDGRNTVYE